MQYLMYVLFNGKIYFSLIMGRISERLDMNNRKKSNNDYGFNLDLRYVTCNANEYLQTENIAML